MKKKRVLLWIAYSIYVVTIFVLLALSLLNTVYLDMFTMICVVAIAAIFLFFGNTFFTPRQMDTIEMLQNKQAMKTDSILWIPMLFLEAPFLISFIIIMIV